MNHIQELTIANIIDGATFSANAIALDVLGADKSGSNGSEAWQAVQIRVDGRSSIAKELKRLEIRKDSYWGFVVSARNLNNYFAEEAWTTEFARVLNMEGISARRVERLL